MPLYKDNNVKRQRKKKKKQEAEEKQERLERRHRKYIKKGAKRRSPAAEQREVFRDFDRASRSQQAPRSQQADTKVEISLIYQCYFLCFSCRNLFYSCHHGAPWSYGAVEVPGAVAISCTVRFMYQREYDQSGGIRCSSESNTPPPRLCSEPCDGTPKCQQTSEPCENKAPMPLFFHKDSHWFQESARSPPRSLLPPTFLSTAKKQMVLHHLQNKPHKEQTSSLVHQIPAMKWRLLSKFLPTQSGCSGA